MTRPTVDPHERVDVPPADSYQVDEPVWVWRRGRQQDGWWREGTVRGTDSLFLMVDYATSETGGRAVDTVRPEYVMRRERE